MKLGGQHMVGRRIQALAKAQDPGTAAVGGRSPKARRRSGLAPLATAAAALSIVFSFSVGASRLGAQTLDVIHGFANYDGAHPAAAVIEASDGFLYGTTSRGGDYGPEGGTVFRVNKDGMDFLTLYDFGGNGGNDGFYVPAGLLEASDGALYGAAQNGGAHGGGVIFKLEKAETGYFKLHEFYATSPDGTAPDGTLIEGSDGALYGTTQGGAYPNAQGVVFRLNKDGSGYLTLHAFSGGDGATLFAGVIEGTDGALYGTTFHGGNYDAGTAFKINKDGSGFLTLHHFDINDGADPLGRLVEASDGALYGTAAYGGFGFGGVVFKINKDGSGFLKLHEFYDEGYYPAAGLH